MMARTVTQTPTLRDPKYVRVANQDDKPASVDDHVREAREHLTQVQGNLKHEDTPTQIRALVKARDCVQRAIDGLVRSS